MKRDYAGYFDYAAATPTDGEILSIIDDYAVKNFFNPSALYSSGSKMREVVESARRSVAKVLEVKPQQIIWTSGCTEANNLAIKGVMSQYPNAKILISAVEHDSVYLPATNYQYKIIPVDDNGIIDLAKFEDLLDDSVALVSVIYANNETGAIQPLREISNIIKKYLHSNPKRNLPLYFHSDAAQAANFLDLHANGLGLDMMSLNGSKIYGSKATGCLYISSSVNIVPLVNGGGQERGLRSGTEFVGGVVGFSEALNKSQAMRSEVSKRISELQVYLEQNLIKMGGEINTNSDKLPNITNVSYVGLDNEILVLELDKIGFMVSSGSACHAKSGVKSRVLSSMGKTEAQIDGSLRISMGRFTTQSDVESLVRGLEEIIAKNR
ncbi:cysteine desulfurase [Candidatus Saccharibacteria bacterium]|nr:cysteine desulfurase [Candidatus Saccharibacteria bacterium]